MVIDASREGRSEYMGKLIYFVTLSNVIDCHVHIYNHNDCCHCHRHCHSQ